jgi:hypothetical protein
LNEFSLFLTLALDISLIVLLTVVVIYAYVLNRRLRTFKTTTAHLNLALKKLDTYNSQTEKSLENLKETAVIFDKNYTNTLERAQSLRDELAFIVDRSESSTSKLEETIRTARDLLSQTQKVNLEKQDSALIHLEAFKHITEKKEEALQTDENLKSLPASEVEQKLIQALKAVR